MIPLLSDELEVVICEDKSPKRIEVREAVRLFKASSKLNIRYFENEQNLGYDKNLRELISKAEGEFVIFIGDDDAFGVGDWEILLISLKVPPSWLHHENSYFHSSGW
ncbi:MAG: glycosyltransferase [Saprospiraceae bacterium]|nr:glycosyltransferase [Candidatus Brachybacter algidus]